jgi:hypothetical protein
MPKRGAGLIQSLVQRVKDSAPYRNIECRVLNLKDHINKEIETHKQALNSLNQQVKESKVQSA